MKDPGDMNTNSVPHDSCGPEQTARGAPVFFNREMSWIDFNERVLGEGLRKNLPPLERLKYLSIVSSNFDEFFMVRVAALKRAMHGGGGTDPSGQSPSGLLEKITGKVRLITERQYAALANEVFQDLAAGGLKLIRPREWTESQRMFLESFFALEVYAILTPLRLDDEESFPSIDNYSLYAAFLLESDNSEECISVIHIPQTPGRIVWLPAETETPGEITGGTRRACWALLEDLIEVFGGCLYPGYKVKESLIFKVNRDADFSVDEKRDEDFIMAMAEVLEGRDSSMPVRLVYTPGSVKIRDSLARHLFLGEDDLFEIAGPLNLEELYELIIARGFDKFREKPWNKYPHPAFSDPAPAGDESVWDRISQGDVLLHLPYQSFDPVVRFFQEAAKDPQVAAIKATLYRTSGDSPIVRALEQASLAGKHVTAVVELKARFDEGRNISWANRLEKAGVIVVYGLARLKIHAKVSIVMRREYDRIKRYVHLSTGNYNDRTAKIYEDLSLFTAREEIAYDAGLLFNMITGYSAGQPMAKLVTAPTVLKRRLLELIAREINRSSPESPGRIMAKMNALADPDIIRALYRASGAGVRVSLCVRGICMLVPGVKDLSENIRVVSVIDYYLEHSRIYYFANGGTEELYLSSADWMPRNLERRVEIMFPVLQEDLRKAVFETLAAYFRDNCQSWLLDSEGVWTRLEPAPGEKPFRVQSYLYSRAALAQTEEHSGTARGEFIVRRSPPNP
jgi:polyphosphate kinase